MDPNENIRVLPDEGHAAPHTPPAGGFGAPGGGGSAPFGFTQWGPGEGPPLVAPVDKMARFSLYLGIASIPGIFMCNVIGLPAAVAAVSLGIAALYRLKRLPNVPGRGQAIGGLVCGGVVIAGTTALLAYFCFCVPGWR